MLEMSNLQTRLAELMMAQLDPCDLGDGIEVVHDVEDHIEISMECDLDGDDDPARADQTLELTRDAIEALEAIAAEAIADEVGTREFVRFSAPYERIEIQFEPRAFVRATIEDAKALCSA